MGSAGVPGARRDPPDTSDGPVTRASSPRIGGHHGAWPLPRPVVRRHAGNPGLALTPGHALPGGRFSIGRRNSCTTFRARKPSRRQAWQRFGRVAAMWRFGVPNSRGDGAENLWHVCCCTDGRSRRHEPQSEGGSHSQVHRESGGGCDARGGGSCAPSAGNQSCRARGGEGGRGSTGGDGPQPDQAREAARAGDLIREPGRSSPARGGRSNARPSPSSRF